MLVGIAVAGIESHNTTPAPVNQRIVLDDKKLYFITSLPEMDPDFIRDGLTRRVKGTAVIRLSHSTILSSNLKDSLSGNIL